MARIRLTGAGPWSLQWEYIDSNRDVVRRVLLQLEDRRVLFESAIREDFDFCRQSAQKIRDLLNLELANVKAAGQVDRAFRKMRKSARDFVSAAGQNASIFAADPDYFFACLNAFRISIGIEVVSLATEFSVDLDEDFAQSLPIQNLGWIPGFEHSDD